MSRIILNKLGPIEHCELEETDFMVFMGPQSSGKSTIAKSVFYFKNVKNMLMQIVRRLLVASEEVVDISLKNRLIREMRLSFLQTFGTTWCMDSAMCMTYEYGKDLSVSLCLKNDQDSPNYVWVTLSRSLEKFLGELEREVWQSEADLMSQDQIRKQINSFFGDEKEVVYIPAGRSMITLLSSQLNYVYSAMDDSQRRSIDYCTQNYLERILQLKPFFSVSMEELITNQITMTDRKIDVSTLKQLVKLTKEILSGEYRNVNGEERLQISDSRYVKINFASSGQQEAVWILNVLFYYLLQGKQSYFIIEEPESHLYPAAQKLIAEFIAMINNAGNHVLLTTHSPYMLGALNNLLYANSIAEMVDAEALDRIIPQARWLKYDKFAAYQMENGSCIRCMDNELQAIRNEVIDGASAEINEAFDDMLELELQ